MSKELLRTKAALKTQWLAVNRHILDLRRQAAEAEKMAGALQKALDALEAVTPGLSEPDSTPSPRKSSGATILRLTDELKTRGPMTARQLADTIGISYFAVNANLRKGPFQTAGSVKAGHRTAQTWKIAETNEAGTGAPATTREGETT